jgi:hypothetical protein
VLSALRKNSLSILLSGVALTGYGGWLSLPESASIQSIYDRYFAREESRPRVFEEGVTIRLNREAPPVAALEEALRDQPWTSIERTPGFNVRATELKIQPMAPERIAVRILSENELFQRQLSLRLNAQRAVAPAVNLAPAIIAPPVNLPANRARAIASEARGGASYTPSAKALLKSRRLETLNVESAPTVSISMSKTGLSREQILAALFGPITQNAPQVPMGSYSAAAFGSQKSKSRSSASANSKPGNNPASIVSPAEARSNVLASAGAVGLPMDTDKASLVGGESVDTGSVASRAMGMVAPAGRQIMIRGPIELSGGLALTHAKDRIAVLRESRGQFVESGAVWIREARYEIFVESLEGQLVAEVRSPQGDVVGRGHLELSTVVTGSNGKTAEGVALRVLPVTPGIAGRVQSAYANGSSGASQVSKGLRGARVESLNTPSVVKTTSGGHFEDARFTEGSRVVANIQTKDHWPTLVTLTSGEEPVIPVFSKKMMQAFVSLTSKDEHAAEINMKTNGVIWGRVTRGGQTVAGAELNVITEGAGDPVYFNDLMLPDASMKTTGSNGIFAIPAVATGLHGVQVRLGKRLSDPVFVQADVQSVASLDLDILKASEIPARAFDAFRTETSLRAEVRPMGHLKTRKMLIEGDDGTVVKLANMGLPEILEVDGGSEYLSTRMIQNPDTRHLYLPMVQRSWFDRVVGHLKFNSPPQTGNIIGFIQGSRFRVSMDAQSLSRAAKIVYFDSRGELTGKEYGEPGDGFILFGVNSGLQTVIVEADGTDRIFAATAIVEDGYVASLSHWLR